MTGASIAAAVAVIHAAKPTITLTKMRTLLSLPSPSVKRREPRPGMRELAKVVGMSVPNMSRVISSLVEDGLVLRDGDPVDQRGVSLCRSAEGERIVAKAVKAAGRLVAA